MRTSKKDYTEARKNGAINLLNLHICELLACNVSFAEALVIKFNSLLVLPFSHCSQ